METKEQTFFWLGYELGLKGRRLPVSRNEWIWEGWSHGHIERERWFKVRKWEARRKHFKEFFRINVWHIKGLEFKSVILHPDMIDVRS
jgi:hypothetical protein